MSRNSITVLAVSALVAIGIGSAPAALAKGKEATERPTRTERPAKPETHVKSEKPAGRPDTKPAGGDRKPASYPDKIEQPKGNKDIGVGGVVKAVGTGGVKGVVKGAITSNTTANQAQEDASKGEALANKYGRPPYGIKR